MSQTAFRASGVLLIVGAALLGLAFVMLSFDRGRGEPLSPAASLVSLLSSVALLISIPAMYARQSQAAGSLGLAGYLLLQGGIVLVVLYSSTPVLYPSFKEPPAENPVGFFLGIAMVVGLLLTSIATMRAGVFPRTAGILMFAATVAFFFSFFIAELLPDPASQVGTAFLGLLLALSLAWIGLSLLRMQLQSGG